MLNMAPSKYNTDTASESTSLKMQAVAKEQANFIRKYRLIPQTREEFDEMLSGKLVNEKVIPAEVTQTGKLPSFAFGYNSPIHGAQEIYSDIFKNAGVLFVFMPGPFTPTCDGTHLPSFMDVIGLKALKELGVDTIAIVTPGISDPLCIWMRGTLERYRLSHLMPDSLPERSIEPSTEIIRNDMPTFVAVPDQGLAFTNFSGLIHKNDHRLGMLGERAYAFYKNGELLKVHMAKDPGQASCGPVLAKAIIDDLRTLQSKLKLTINS